MAEVIDNYNKIIDLELTGDAGNFKIECPITGRKPNITIKGSFDSKDMIDMFEVRIKNLYTDTAITNYQTLTVWAGYEKNKTVCITGSIVNAYTESPGPERVTVFQCQTASFTDWISAVCNLHFTAGTTCSDILTQLSDIIGFNTPVVVKISETLKAPLQFNGAVKDLIHELREYFPDILIRIDNNRFTACNAKSGTDTIYNIDYISSPPQFTGASVTVTAPWIPALRPADFIHIDTKYFIQDQSAYQTKTGQQTDFRASNIQFEFSTVESVNTMTIMAVTDKEDSHG